MLTERRSLTLIQTVHVFTLCGSTLKLLSPPCPAGGAAVRRRQPEEPPGEGEAGSLPHAALHPSRLSEPPARHDRSGRRQEAHGTTRRHAELLPTRRLSLNLAG